MFKFGYFLVAGKPVRDEARPQGSDDKYHVHEKFGTKDNLAFGVTNFLVLYTGIAIHTMTGRVGFGQAAGTAYRVVAIAGVVRRRYRSFRGMLHVVRVHHGKVKWEGKVSRAGTFGMFVPRSCSLNQSNESILRCCSLCSDSS